MALGVAWPVGVVMGRNHFFTDRALIVRAQDEVTLGVHSKAGDVELGDWIPCRLREPDGDADIQRGKYELNPTHLLHMDYKDLSGIRVRLKQADTIRIYQRIEDYWVEFGQPFRIVGSIQPKRRRTRLVSYIVPVYAPEIEY